MIGWLKSIRWKTRTRRSVFVTLLVSYILIMLIPLGIGAFIYGRMSAAMVEQAVRSNSGLLEQAKQAIDQRLADLDKVSIQIALNTKLLSLLGNGPDSQRNESLVHSEVIRDFGRLLASNGFIDELYVYLRNGDIILTSSMKTDTDIFFNWIQPTTQPDAAAKMRAFLSQTHYREFLLPISYNTDSNRSSKRVISYVQSLPIEEQQSVRGSLVIQFEENKLLQVLKQIEWVNQGDIVIVDDKGQVITSTSPNRNEWSSLSEQLTKEGDSLETRLGGSQMMVTYTTSNVNGWKFVSVVPKAAVMERVEDARTVAYIALLICLLAGAAACWYMANRNYYPIRQILNTVLQGSDVPASYRTNEYDLIRNALVQSFTEEKQLRQKLFNQLPVMQTNLIARLMRGQVDGQALNSESLSFMDISFASEHFAVILLDIDDCSRFIQEDTEKEWALVRFTIANLSRDTPYGHCYPIELDRNRMALLFNPAAPEANTPSHAEQLKHFANALLQTTRETFRLQLSFGLSTIVEGLDMIKSAYDEAVLALEYKIIKGSGTLTAFAEVADLQQYYYRYPLETEAQIMNYAKSGDFQSIERQLDELFHEHFVENLISVQMGRCLFIDMLGTPLKLLNTLYASDPINAQREADRVDSILRSSTAEEMLAGTKEWYRQICQTVKSERSDHGEKLYLLMTRYVEQHYGENYFSLTHLADELGLTPQYLSSFFKKHTGQNLTDYVTMVRIEQAKVLLRTSSLTMTQIANAIGYANDAGLIRVFKKHEGITPGKYRDNMNED